MTNSVRFEVQTYTLCQGWINCWMVDDEPETFATASEAWAAITEHIEDAKTDIDDPDYWPNEEEFRVVRAGGKASAPN